MKTYRHADILKIFPDLKTRTLISWSEKEFFRPYHNPHGTGTRREYSEVNLVQIGILRALLLNDNKYPSSLIKLILNSFSIYLNKFNNFDCAIILFFKQLKDGFTADIEVIPSREISKKFQTSDHALTLVTIIFTKPVWEKIKAKL